MLINPLLRSADPDKAKVYKAEPYVLAGDVYGCAPYRGRAGWTWYTGSAGWLLYVLTEDFFGVKRRGDRLYVEPNLPAGFGDFEAEIRLDGKRILIRYERADEDALFLGGKRIDYYDLTRAEKDVVLLRHFH